MGYQTIKEGIGKMMKAKGFMDSPAIFTFEEETDQNLNKKFRLERDEIDLQAEGVEYLATLVRPVFNYTLTLGFKLAAERQGLDYDVSQNLVDTILAYFCNPVNYTTYCIKIKVKHVISRLVDEHLEVEFKLEVLDDITLT
jgi:hypothetical protein